MGGNFLCFLVKKLSLCGGVAWRLACIFFLISGASGRIGLNNRRSASLDEETHDKRRVVCVMIRVPSLKLIQILVIGTFINLGVLLFLELRETRKLQSQVQQTKKSTNR